MTQDDAKDLQRELGNLFNEYDLAVGTGLIKFKGVWGVAIRSQTPLVDARNIGEVQAL